MPTQPEIVEIETRFAKTYGVDTKALRKDAKALANYAKRYAIAAADDPPVFSGLSNTKGFAPKLEDGVDVSKIKPDPRLVVRQIEANLDEATKLVQLCQAARERYGDLAKKRSDVRFKGEEFARLDKVHQAEIDSGLYQLPWQEADSEVEGLKAAIAHASEQESILSDVFGETGGTHPYSSLLKEERIRENIADNVFITRSTANIDHESVEERATTAATFRGFIEEAAWLERWSGMKIALGQMKPKLEAVQRKATYLHLDEAFKHRRRDINRELAWLQLEEHTEKGSELNYDERLRSYKEVYVANLVPLIERALLIDQGLRELYRIRLDLGDLEQGSLLDRLSVWLTSVQDQTSKWKRTQRLTINQFVSPVHFDASGTFSARFDISESDLPSNSLLRGANFEYLSDQVVPLTIFLTPPDNPDGVGSERLKFGRVCPFSPGLDLRPQHVEVFWNVKGIGEWKVDGACPEAEGQVRTLVLYLWTMSP